MGQPKTLRRAGSVLPLVCFSALALLGFVALAVDLGVVAVARTQCQNVADTTAMAGARSLNGDKASSNNLSAAGLAARGAAGFNDVLTQKLPDNQVTFEFGSYGYNDANQKFEPRIPKLSSENWNLCKTTARATGATYFAKVLGISSFGTTTTAIAVHRPRDVALVLDFSGSMRFGSLPGVGIGGPRSVSGRSGSNNPESVFPQFGHYASVSAAGLQRTSAVTMNGDTYDLANFTEATPGNDNRMPVVGDFYQHAAGSTASPAFQSAGDGDGQGWVSGDKFHQSNSVAWPSYTPGSNYAENVQQLLNLPSVDNTTRDWRWELDGYSANIAGNVDGGAAYSTTVTTNPDGRKDYTTVPFSGWTEGPRYWGKTFFMWPPDPRYPLLNTATDRNAVQQFILDFYGNSSGQQPVPSEVAYLWQNWPWTIEQALTNHLENQLGLNADHPIHQRILRLHNRPKADWRKKFFLKSDDTPQDDNSQLWTSEGEWRSPRSGSTTYYKINYQAVLTWLFTEGPNPFPARLRAGRILYYDALPNCNDTGLNSRWWSSFPLADYNERFWKEYIDYVLGVRQTGASSWDEPSSSTPNIVAYTGYGADYAWGSGRITAVSALSGTPVAPYLHYQDNPNRPRLHFWFGPMSLVDFLGNYNLGGRSYNQSHWWWPGTCHEAPLYACKIGIRAALQDIEKNHPNDHVSLIMFNVPRTSASDVYSARRFNRVRAPLSRDYTRMIDSLWFPTYTLDNPGTEIRIYDFENNLEVPRAMGGTCYAMGLMLAYNQFSSRTELRTYNPAPAPGGDGGGLGRRGAQKVVIFETDGLPNHRASAAIVDGGPYQSYYRVRSNSSNPSAGEFPSVNSDSDNSTSVTSQIYALCQQITALDTAAPPGYSTPRKPALIHCIGFGAAVAPGSPERAGALATLAEMESIGNIPAAKRIGAVPYKTVYGSDDQMISTLRTAISSIMQDGVQVTLIE